MNFRMHSTPVVALLIMASLGTKAQTSLPPWEHDNNFSSTIHNMYQIDDDNFDGTTYGHNYATWLLFGRVAASRYVSNSGNGYDNSPKRIGFVSTEDTYIDWYPGANKRVGSKQFESMNFGFISSSNAYLMSARSRTNIMTLTKDGNVGIGDTNPNARLNVSGNITLMAKFVSSNSWETGVEFRNTSGGAFKLNVAGSGNNQLPSKGMGIYDATNNEYRMVIGGSGNVGIGTTAPNDKLHLVTTGTRTSAGNEITYAGTKPQITSSLRVTNSQDNTSSSYDTQMGISLYGTTGSTGKYPFLEIETKQADVPIIMEVNDKATMQIFQNQVLIGSDLPFPTDAVVPFSGTNYTLGVRGNIVSSGVTCKDLSKWADYVFDDHYKLKPLNEVETYIAQNKHLPDVPSEEEVKKNGVDLVEMLKVHMQKIEELTLYTIEQQKLLKEQQRQINELKQQLAVPRQ